MRPCWAVITAAGSGVRLGCEGPKALVDVAGRPMLSRSLDIFKADPQVERICVTAPVEWVDRFGALAGPDVRVVPGGTDRQTSVRAGIEAVSDNAAWPNTQTEGAMLLIHDAARPFTPAAVLRRVIERLEAGAKAVLPAIPVTDTIRQVGADESQNSASQVAGALVDRSGLRAMQTPQGFDADFICQAYRQVGDVSAFTDDGAIAQAVGEQVVLVPGDSMSFKITVPLDLQLAEAVAAL